MAKKKKKPTKAEKRWKQRKKLTEVGHLQRLVARLENDNVEYQINTGSDKVSDRLTDVADPLMTDIVTKEQAEKNLLVAAAGWNMAILSADARDEAIAEFASRGRAEDADIMRLMMETMIARKLELYPDDRRFIREVHVESGIGQWHVQVAYELDPLPLAGDPPAQD